MISELDETTGEFRAEASRKAPSEVRVRVGSMTHPGHSRPRNEDRFLVATLAKLLRVDATNLDHHDAARLSSEVGHLFVVADGMGGAAAGERASEIAVETVEDFALNSVKWFLHLPGCEENALMGELKAGIERADRRLIDEARFNPRLSGMGTTLTMAFHVSDDLFVVHAGDSRAYLFRRGELDQITCDHTLVQVLIEAGAISPEAARTHSRRHVVTNVLGGPTAGVRADVHKVKLDDGDVFILCSDGLTEPLPDAEIADVLSDHPEPKDAAEQLVRAALDRGGPDNITVVVARFVFED